MRPLVPYRGHELALPPIGVALFSYGFDYKAIHSYTAPFTRLMTGKQFNHGAVFLFAWGEWWLIESAEQGVTIRPLASALDRNKSRIELRPYYGSLQGGAVYSDAIKVRGFKYDKMALLHQWLYRFTKELARHGNNFVGYDYFRKGIWVGKTGEAAKGKYGCFELVFSLLGLPDAHLASGSEFVQQGCFGPALFTELK